MAFKNLPASRLVDDIDELSTIEANSDELGAKINGNHGEVYEFVQFVDLDVVEGDVVELAELSFDDEGKVDTLSVTKDRDGSSLGRAAVRGVVVATSVDADHYGWIQIQGVCPKVNQSGSVSAGDELVANGSADGEVRSMSAGEEAQVIGVAAEDLVSTCSASLIPRT